MSAVTAAWLELGVFVLVLTLLTPVLGRYLATVFADGPHPLGRLLGALETGIYRACRIDPAQEMTWTTYLAAVGIFTAVSMAALFGLLCVQQWLPLNPQHFPNFPPLLAFNVAVSFATTTNWQAYSGENTLGYLAQMAGLAWQNFVAAAVGLAVLFAAIRGFTRSSARTLGSFWVDLTRSWLYVLLPISVVGALLLISQGTPQNFAPYETVKNAEGFTQAITGGPMASQTIIEQLGVNGGGFVAANVAAPNLNPTPLSDLLMFIAMFLLGAALTNAFGRMVGNVRHGWVLYGVMLGLFIGGFAVVSGSEHGGNPLIHQLGIAGSNLEGKETRFGDVSSALSVTVATDTSSGAANVAYDSLMPLSVLIAMLNMQIGEIVFGGVGSGLYGMIILVMLTIFIAGLMIGRTPEYLGKKIGRREITLVVIATLIAPLATLVPSAIALAPGLSSVGNGGPRALAEVLYAFTSVQANNGSVLGGLNIQTDFYNALTAVVMLAGRFGTLIVILAIAGSLVRQPRNTRPSGALSPATVFFGVLLAATALVVTALTFLPADALGPVAEALILRRHGSF
ncbi:MAG TPA: potassium-transporting ATPase subunit KdpA [Candidatus Lustribacter sp.]|jgi:K+-transporting ATPase ATPase A chain|nr:potassium-transporting ATPase subunit KdpA [Candidatus Lustribacter sp.]